MTQILRTDAVAQRERMAYWTDVICDVYVQLDCDSPASSDFSGSIERDVLAGLEVSVVESRAQHVRRTPRQIAKASEDYFLVSIQDRGRGAVRQDGRSALLQPGDFALYDSTRPYELLFDGDFRQLVLMVPGQSLRTQVRHAEQLTATAVSGTRGAGHLLLQMVDFVRREAGLLPPVCAPAVADGLLHVLVAALRTLPPESLPALPELAAYHLERIKAYVREHLRDPALNVGRIGAALRLSSGHLHRLFQNEPMPLAHYIWRQRLEACHRDLADSRHARRSISDIDFGWGFNDAAHFSRAFRERYGLSPREWRTAAASADRGSVSPAASPRQPRRPR
jgi:AraC-like DNA-binding protein